MIYNVDEQMHTFVYWLTYDVFIFTYGESTGRVSNHWRHNGFFPKRGNL